MIRLLQKARTGDTREKACGGRQLKTFIDLHPLPLNNLAAGGCQVQELGGFSNSVPLDVLK